MVKLVAGTRSPGCRRSPGDSTHRSPRSGAMTIEATRRSFSRRVGGEAEDSFVSGVAGLGDVPDSARRSTRSAGRCWNTPAQDETARRGCRPAGWPGSATGSCGESADREHFLTRRSESNAASREPSAPPQVRRALPHELQRGMSRFTCAWSRGSESTARTARAGSNGVSKALSWLATSPADATAGSSDSAMIPAPSAAAKTASRRTASEASAVTGYRAGTSETAGIHASDTMPPPGRRATSWRTRRHDGPGPADAGRPGSDAGSINQASIISA